MIRFFRMPASAGVFCALSRRRAPEELGASLLVRQSAARLRLDADERTGGFGVIKEGAAGPDAVFSQIEAAIVWGLTAHGHGGFCVRWVAVESLPAPAPAPIDEVPAAQPKASALG